MTTSKYRAAIGVFFVGFALGLSVFVATRLFVRSVLNNDALATAQEIATQVAKGGAVETSAALSAVVRYTRFGMDGTVVASAAPGVADAPPAQAISADQVASVVSAGQPVIERTPVTAILFGLPESALKRVIVPIASDGKPSGAVLVEIDQTRALEPLTRAFTVVGMVIVGLAVLAVIAVAFMVTRGRGFARQGRTFDPSSLPRDPLTDVPTRSGLAAVLEDAVTRAAAADKQLGLLIVGLDGFRAVNDIWGHAAGDEVLQMTAERLRGFANGPAGVARIAGDEFAVIVEEADTNTLRHLADQIREAMREPFEIEGSGIVLGASIGAALYPINAENGQFLFRAADSALSRAKAHGRNSLAVFDTEMKHRLMKGAQLDGDMRLALSRNEFVVFYQPQFDLTSGKVRGFEALVRWERPGEGILSSRNFLEVAEETGLIRDLGEWVLRTACKDAASWLDQGTVAVNFSAAQFHSQEPDKLVARVLKETGLPAHRLEIEVPESLFLSNAPTVMKTLGRIKKLGVRVAMDGFGGSYTGLASLARFPFDEVKIDATFVSQLTEDASVAPIVSAVVALGRTLSADVTAEGVETKEQLMLLKAAGCNVAQGFLFGAPNRDEAAQSTDMAGTADSGPKAASKA